VNTGHEPAGGTVDGGKQIVLSFENQLTHLRNKNIPRALYIDTYAYFHVFTRFYTLCIYFEICLSILKSVYLF